MKVIDTLWACTDCIAYIANGELPPDRPTLPGLIRAHLSLTAQQHLVCSGERDDWFSWQPCDTCGGLAGMRNEVAILGPDA